MDRPPLDIPDEPEDDNDVDPETEEPLCSGMPCYCTRRTGCPYEEN